MTKAPEQKAAEQKLSKPVAPVSGPLFAIGIDDKGKARGGRFAEYDDRLASALLDLGLNIVITPSPAFANAAKKLPEGRRYSSGKMAVADVRPQLIEELLAIVRQPGDTSGAFRLAPKPPSPDDPPVIRCKSPITSGLPRNWDEVDIGHLVIAEESPDDGHWPAVVVKREHDVLTLRWRDAPKVPLFVRHITTVALVNPGPLAEPKS